MKRAIGDSLAHRSMIIMANFEPAFFKPPPMPEFIEGGGGLEGA
jgi:hypothetical protein